MPRSIATALATLAIVAGSAGPAAAGYCPPEYVAAQVRAIERFGARGGAEPNIEEICTMEVEATPKLLARVIKACDAILVRTPGYWDCLDWAAAAGAKTVGGVDVFLAIAKAKDLDPFADGRLTVGLYVELGDPRAAAPVRAAWQAALTDPRLGKKKFAHVWAVFQNNAVALFTAVGGADERQFLAARLPLTKGPSLRKRMQKALAAIDQRAAAKP